MANLPAKPIPSAYQRIVLVNPTRYLGNLLLAGGLIQGFYAYCQSRGISFRVVIDESFKDLCEGALPAEVLIYYPRQRIKKVGAVAGAKLYLNFLNQLRSFKADIAFNIEEDSVAHRLTQLSKAKFKLGCSTGRHRWFYQHVLAIKFEGREKGREHRWYSFFEVFSTLGMPEPSPEYIKLQLNDLSMERKAELESKGWNSTKKTLVLHAGATKEYKKWPFDNVVALCKLLLEDNRQVVLIGAGSADQAANEQIISALKAHVEQEQANEKESKKRQLPIDLCNGLSLSELASFLKDCTYMVGNDSGPFHLGSALGLNGSVIFGPTNAEVWRPLGKNSELLTGKTGCDPQCSKAHCLYDHRCLREVSAESVFENSSAS